MPPARYQENDHARTAPFPEKNLHEALQSNECLPEIPSLLARGEKTVTITRELVIQLKERLTGVLRPTAAKSVRETPCDATAPVSALGVAIEINREIAESANARLSEILRRLEL